MAFARRTMRCSSSPSLTIFTRSARSTALRKLRFVFTRRVESIPLIRSNDFRKSEESRYTFVTAADGETRRAAQWVGAGGRARKLTGAKLTREGFEVGACVCVHAKGMKEAWHLAASDGARSAKEIADLYAKRWTIEPS